MLLFWNNISDYIQQTQILTAIVEDSAAVDAADEESTFDELGSIMPY